MQPAMAQAADLHIAIADGPALAVDVGLKCDDAN